VLENNVNQSFTYQLDGPDVTYLGEGDLHDEAFDHMLVSADVSEFLSTYASVETEGFTAVPLSGEGVQYSLRVYPSQDMKDDFVTNQPVIFSLIVALVFVFTSGVFFIYNVLVERRQKIVMDRAVKSTAVVSSLFPENVKELLLNEGEEERDKKVSWRASERKQDLNNNTVAMMSETRPKGKPIADRFENTTIIFADIAGFTSWSSEREPEHVFELLETLYAAFDALALARSVFKVETIGDCYLAITGVPKPQPDHAIRMVKFARDCMHKVKDLINSLAESLGDDTRNLSFRVGLHSGSVTAGVLRGDKSRFQLFGDTVNTAARMESHGIKGRIHVSQSTADELVKAGKPGWIVPRQDKISAKGKGDLQTYFMDERFMNVKVGKSTASVSSPSLESSEIGDSDGDDHST
jgi:class 3 adenylate cyclase